MSRVVPRRGYADGPFGQIHYREHGTGDPLVLLHQAPMTAGQFDNVYGPLAARGIRAIGIDMPGFGGSDVPDKVPYVEDYAECVMPVLDALGLAKANVAGHHTGALVATEVAVRWPDRVISLIQAGPMPLTDEERQAWLESGHVRERGIVARSGGGHMTDIFAGRERMAAGSVPFERLTSYVVQALSGQGEYWYGHHAAFQYRQADALKRVTARTLILTNSGDQIYEHALRAHALRPDFELVTLQGGGIDIVDQQPEEWSDAVRAFLDGNPAS